MKITLCGSIAFINEMNSIRLQLEQLGYEVEIPPLMVPDEDGSLVPALHQSQQRKAAGHGSVWMVESKHQLMHEHFKKVAWSDAVLICNFTKKEVENYIGGNTFLEMGIALYLNKKIFLLNAVPKISYEEEIVGMKPIILNGDFSLIQ